jgi:hypothetical protein
VRAIAAQPLRHRSLAIQRRYIGVAGMIMGVQREETHVGKTNCV